MKFNKIKEYRKQRKLSQKELAIKSGVSRTWIQLLEKGSENPSIEIMEKISEILLVPMKTWWDDIELKNSNDDFSKSLIEENEKLKRRIERQEDTIDNLNAQIHELRVKMGFGKVPGLE